MAKKENNSKNNDLRIVKSDHQSDAPTEVIAMPDGKALKNKPERFINRELSWLSFNQRVLDEANNANHPLFERLRFLSISISNLDEFFMVRVAGLKGQDKAGVTARSTDGLSPAQQLLVINARMNQLIEDIEKTWDRLKPLLVENDIQIIRPDDLSAKDKKWLEDYFEQEIFPILSPLAVDPAHPFPFIPNQGLAIALQLYNKNRKQEFEAVMQLPAQLGRYIKIGRNDHNYILLEHLVMMFIDKIFPDPVKVRGFATFRILRDSEMEIDDEAEDLVLTFETALKQRRRGSVIMLAVNSSIDEEILEFLQSHLNVSDDGVIKSSSFVVLPGADQIITNDKRDLLFRPFDARFPERIRDFSGDCFAAISHKDIVVHHPYESFNVVVDFIKQASRDPDVVSIKQTLYRTGSDSSIAKALIDAAEAGKSVTAMVELKARFDEEANIRWAKDMERAGVQVVYGFVDLKTHAKVSLVLRRENNKLKPYGHFGTGNYHPQKAKIYTDLSYFTCDPDLCHDMALMFNFMTGYARPNDMRKLSMAPLDLRETISDLIDKEIEFAKKGKPAAIWMKCNSLLDAKVIDKLYAASNAGVQIDLVVRGICALRPGIPDLSENIRVKSIVGRYLEHSRIYCFGNGHKLPSRKAKVFIASADMMSRNLSRRIEALVPINNKTVHKQILDQIMVANFKDKKQSWIMDYQGHYQREEFDDESFSAHSYFMNNPSLSGRGTALDDDVVPPRLSLKNLISRQSKS